MKLESHFIVEMVDQYFNRSIINIEFHVFIWLIVKISILKYAFLFMFYVKISYKNEKHW